MTDRYHQESSQQPPPTQSQLEFFSNIATQMAIFSTRLQEIKDEFNRVYIRIQEKDSNRIEEDAKTMAALTALRNDLSHLEEEVRQMVRENSVWQLNIREQFANWQGKIQLLMWIGGIAGAILLSLFQYVLTRVPVGTHSGK